MEAEDKDTHTAGEQKIDVDKKELLFETKAALI